MAHQPARKPANRPSRRQDLVDAGIELFSLQPSDLVTVASIVERAGMTPAAFYYHFTSREQLLEQIVETYAATWIGHIENLLAAAKTRDDLARIGVVLLDRLDEEEQLARIFFLSGVGVPLLVERIRRDARNRLIRSAARAVARIDRDRKSAQALVSGVAMIVTYEAAARSRLTLDESYRTLGPRRFREQVASLGAVVTSPGTAADAASNES